MPLYAYACLICNVELTKLQKYGDAAPVCPERAEHGEMRKLLTAPTFNLQGPGVYSPGVKVKK